MLEEAAREAVLGRKAQLNQGRVAAGASRGDRRCTGTADHGTNSERLDREVGEGVK